MATSPSVLISIEADNADELKKAVQSGLFAYHEQFAGPMGNSVLAIAARDSDRKVIAGLVANLPLGWKWMHIHWLWVDESHRRAGIGRLLLEASEKEAQKRSCPHVAVDTFERFSQERQRNATQRNATRHFPRYLLTPSWAIRTFHYAFPTVAARGPARGIPAIGGDALPTVESAQGAVGGGQGNAPAPSVPVLSRRAPDSGGRTPPSGGGP